jgi:hypothetical protein
MCDDDDGKDTTASMMDAMMDFWLEVVASRDVIKSPTLAWQTNTWPSRA